MPPTTVTLATKLENLGKKVQSCRKNSLRDEQRLCKLDSELGNALYKRHVLLHESMLLAGTIPNYQPKKMAFYHKKINASKLFLKESQKLARKRWELACCNTKKEYLLQERGVCV
jgi:hypothetical protein